MNLLSKKKAKIEVLTIYYLLIPNLLFIFTWTKSIFAFIIFLSIILPNLQLKAKILPLNISFKNLLLILLAITIPLLCGIGEWVNQINDYNKHNIVFADLITKDWVVEYVSKTNKQLYFFCYYVGYYLPTAFVAKYTDIAAARYISFIWGFCGIGLVFSWILKVQNKTNILYLLPFIFLGNLHIFIKIIDNSIDLYSFNYLINGLSWLPQTTIPLLLIFLIIYDQIINEATLSKEILFILALSFIWSPFAIMSIMVFLLFWLLRDGIKVFLSISNIIAGGSLTLLMFFYYTSHVKSDIPIGFILNFVPLSQAAKYYSLYYANLLLWLIPLLYLAPKVLKNSSQKTFFGLVIFFSFSIPILYFGKENDLFIKSSFFYIYLGVTLISFYQQAPSFIKIYFIILYVISLASPLRDIYYGMDNNNIEVLTIEQTAKAGRDIFYTEQLYGNFGYVKQSLGDTSSFYYKHLAKLPTK